MPELPEVQTVASELNIKLKSRQIKNIIITTSKVVGIGPAVLPPKRVVGKSTVTGFIGLLKWQKFLSVGRRAKLLIFKLSGGLNLLAHLKMTGQFIFEDQKLRNQTQGQYRLLNKPSAPRVLLPCKHTHVIFDFTDGSRLYFNDLRKFGYLKLVRNDELNQIKELREFGPEPMDIKFTFARFLPRLENQRWLRIKGVLMDQKVIAGIGNIYSDEILFHAKVRPTRIVSSLTKKELKAIYKSIGSVLAKGIKAKGSSVGEFVRTDGSWGSMGKFHFVYGRKGQKCKKCGTIITSVKLNGRTGSFCIKCQK